ncbi:MAG: ABC transporter permease [Flavobacteriales bacterium]|nr:ABC transporter permease [Flavobacteriales bacterium]
MFDKDTWIEILQVILRNPLRAILSGIGVGWGVFMIMITLASAKGLENGVKADMANRATNSMFMWSMQTSMPYKGFQQGRRFEILNEDVEHLRRNVNEVELVSPRVQLGGYQGANNVIYKNKSGAFNVYGDTPDYIKIEPIIIDQGRYLNELDMSEERKICVIGERVNTVLFGKESALGKYIQIQGVSFRVVGVYKSIKTGEDAEEDTQSIYVPLSTFQKAFNYGHVVGWLSILLKEDYPTQVSVDQVLATLKARKSVHPDDPRAFGYWTMAEEMEEIDTVFGGLSIVAFIFGGLALLAGIIGITNIMLVTVKERTKEFGVRRALGARSGLIIRQVMTETVFMTLIFGCLGIMFGVGILWALNEFVLGEASGSFRDPSIGYLTTIFILIIMIVMGALAGLLPALIAVQIKPVEALRTE